MRILMLAARFPYPPHRGDTKVCFNRLRLLSRNHQITLACLADTPPSEEDLAAVRPYCDVHVIAKPRWRSVLDAALRAVLTGAPAQIAYYHSAELAGAAKRLHAERCFDIIHVMLLRVLPASTGLGVPRVIDVNDSQTLGTRHRREHAGGLAGALLLVEEARIRKLEASLEGEAVIVVSDADRTTFPPGVARTIPAGAEIPDVGDVDVSPIPTAIFSGNMGYYPNVQAVTWFVEKCWPSIRAVVPEARLRIVGREAGDAVMALHGRDGVDVVGQVPDMSREIAEAWISVAPMTVAWGMHTKVLEAMAAGVAVVVSRSAGQAFAGTGEDDGLLLCDGQDDFIAKTTRLLSDRDLAVRLGAAAKERVAKSYSWEAATQTVEEIYAQRLGRRDD